MLFLVAMVMGGSVWAANNWTYERDLDTMDGRGMTCSELKSNIEADDNGYLIIKLKGVFGGTYKVTAKAPNRQCNRLISRWKQNPMRERNHKIFKGCVLKTCVEDPHHDH